MSVLEDRKADRALSPEKLGLRIFLQLIRPRPLADPYPLYGRLRDLAPFLPIRFPGVPNGFLVSTYAGCDRLLRDSAFGPPTYEQLDALKPDWRDNAFTSCLYSSMVFRTGKDHRQRRQTASRHFAPRHISTYRAELESIADMLIDRMDGTVDLIEELALPFASLSLGRLLGIPDDEAVMLGRLARQAGGVFEQFATARQHETIAAAGEELVDRLTGIVKTADSDLLASLAASAVAPTSRSWSGRRCCSSAPASTRQRAWSAWAPSCCSTTRTRPGWCPRTRPGRSPRSCATSRRSSWWSGRRCGQRNWKAGRYRRAAWCSA